MVRPAYLRVEVWSTVTFEVQTFKLHDPVRTFFSSHPQHMDRPETERERVSGVLLWILRECGVQDKRKREKVRLP